MVVLAVACMQMTTLPYLSVSHAATGITCREFMHEEPGMGAITNVTATSTEIIVTGWIRIHSALNLQVFDFKEYEDPSAAAMVPGTALASTGINPGDEEKCYDFTAKVPRYASGKDKIYHKYTIALNDAAEGTFTLVDTKHVTVFSGVALNSYAFPESKTKKGLQVQMVDDAQELGLGHAALNFGYERILKAIPGTDTITYTMDGEDFYLDKAKIESFDKQVKSLSDAGMVVTLILLVYPGDTATPSKYIRHPDQSGGSVAAFNTANDNLKYFKAVTEFIIERYTRADQAYGRAVNFIVGNEVNANRLWYNMGDKSLQDFTKDYVRTLRMVYIAAMKKYSNARVYISLDHGWTYNTYTFPGKSTIDEINNQVCALGNFPWHVAYHPYPENLGNPKTWEDTSAKDSFDTPKITFKNLHVLPDYLQQSNFLIDGQQRRIILSEQGFHTPSPASLSDQQIQAAAYAYAYYKVLFDNSIDSFILHRHVDHGGEGGLNLGVWTRANTNDPSAKKLLWNVMQKIDTYESEGVTSFAKPIIGISDWSQVIPGWNASRLAVRTPPRTGVLKRLAGVGGISIDLGDFDAGTDGWVPCDYSDTATRVTSSANLPEIPYGGSGMLEASFHTPAKHNGAFSWKGVTKTFAPSLNLSSTPFLHLAVNSYGDVPNGNRYFVKVRLYSGGDAIMEGVTEITSDSWNLLGMDLSDWAGRSSIDRIKVWFKADSQRVWNGRFQVDDIGATSSADFAAPVNLALNKTTTTSNSITGWGPDKLTNGVRDSGGGTYSTDEFASANISAKPVWVTIDLGSAQTVNQVKLYPRTDRTASGGRSANFPVDFTIQISNDGVNFTTVSTISGLTNPNGAGQALSFYPTFARYVRLYITRLGIPSSDEPFKYRLQLAEMEIYNDITAVAAARVWEYGIDGYTEGWTAQNQITSFNVNGGYLGGTVTGRDPYASSSKNPGVNITNHKMVRIRLKNSTSSNTGQIYFTTDADTGWSEAKHKDFNIVANDSGYTEYVVDMGTVPSWIGTLKQLRVDPEMGAAIGSFRIDYIRITNE